MTPRKVALAALAVSWAFLLTVPHEPVLGLHSIGYVQHVAFGGWFLGVALGSWIWRT